MSNSNINSINSVLFKNETLKNMFNKISDEAQKQLSTFHEYKSEKKDECSINQNNKLCSESDKYNENFTQEFLMERYKTHFPSNLVTPTEFNPKLNLNKNDALSREAESFIKTDVPNCFNFIEKMLTPSSNLEKLSSANWIKCYSELNSVSERFFLTENLKNSLISIENFFSKYSFKGKKDTFICEIDDISFVDSLQILKLKDYHLERKNFIFSTEEESISDDYFSIGQVALIRTRELKEFNNLYITNFNNIKQVK